MQAGKKNKSGAAFNPVTLEYTADRDGNVLKQRDDNCKLRAQIRAKNLD